MAKKLKLKGQKGKPLPCNVHNTDHIFRTICRTFFQRVGCKLQGEKFAAGNGNRAEERSLESMRTLSGTGGKRRLLSVQRVFWSDL